MCHPGIPSGNFIPDKGLSRVQKTAKGGAGPLRHPLSPAFFHLANV